MYGSQHPVESHSFWVHCRRGELSDLGSLDNFGVKMFVFLSLFIFNHYMAVLGVVWAPVGAIICRVIASKLGLNPRRYTMLGGVYSLLLFFPWLYLVLRMLERRASRILIRVFYILALLSWFTTILWIVFLTPDLGLGVTLSITSIGLRIPKLRCVVRIRGLAAAEQG